MIIKNMIPVSYERDSQFAQSILTLLRFRSDDLPGDMREALLSLATEHYRLGEPQTQDAIKALLNLHPVLTQNVASDNMQVMCLLPVCVWASEAAGERNCNLRERLLDWRAHLRKGNGRGLDNCQRALNISYALRDEFSDADLRSLASFWQDENEDALWNQIYTFSDEKLATWCSTTTRLGLFYEHLASLGIKENTPPGKPAWHLRWSQRLDEAMDPMTTQQQSGCIKYWASSPLSQVYILRASKHAAADAWLDSDVQAILMPLLPKNEVARWRMLPWAQQPEPDASAAKAASLGRKNQALARVYCPSASCILDVVTTPEMWQNRKAIDACMAKFANKTPAVDKVDNAGALFDMT